MRMTTTYCPGGCCRDLSDLRTDEVEVCESGEVMCRECVSLNALDAIQAKIDRLNADLAQLPGRRGE